MPAITSAAPASLTGPIVSPRYSADVRERGHRDRRRREARQPGLDIGQAAIPQPQTDDAGGERIPDTERPHLRPHRCGIEGRQLHERQRQGKNETNQIGAQRQPQRPVGRRQALAQQDEARLAQHRAAHEQIAQQRRGAGRRAGCVHQHKACDGQRDGSRSACTRQPVADHDDAQQRHHGGQRRGDDSGIGGCRSFQALEHQHREADHAQQRHEHQVALLSEHHLPELRSAFGAHDEQQRDGGHDEPEQHENVDGKLGDDGLAERHVGAGQRHGGQQRQGGGRA